MGSLFIKKMVTLDLYLTKLVEPIDSLSTVELETHIDTKGNLTLEDDLIQFQQKASLSHDSLITLSTLDSKE